MRNHRKVEKGKLRALFFFSLSAWVGSFAMSASGLFGPLSGRLTNHFGARIVVACGSLICAGGLLFTSVVPGLHLMFLTYGGIFGFGSSLVYMAIYEIVPRYFVKNRSVATGIITMSVGGALVVMTPVCEALLTAFGWRRTFAGLGCLAFLVFLTSWVFDPNVADDETHAAVKDFKEPIHKHRVKVLDLSMWKNRSFVVLNLSQLIIYTGHHLVPLHLVSQPSFKLILKRFCVLLYRVFHQNSLAFSMFRQTLENPSFRVFVLFFLSYDADS